jgi:hypothetical protein
MNLSPHLMLIVDLVGWVGSALVVAAYILVSNNRLSPRGVPYQALNVGGGICLMANAFIHHALPSALVNLVWLAVGLYVLLRGLKPIPKQHPSDACQGPRSNI